MNKIDVVVTWVDGNDSDWIKSKASFSNDKLADKRVSRFRDWDNLRYWFRSIERYAPWVNKIYFVTCGHIPEWLNTKHEKLKIVRHDEFIPSKFLPTFSSRTIDMNLHRIKGLSENFIYFNDDMMINDHVKETDFFIDNLPCECAILNTGASSISGFNKKAKDNANILYLAPNYAVGIINIYFDKKKQIKLNWKKWFNLRNKKYLLRTMLLYPWNNFSGFYTFHIPYSYNKKTYETVWSLEKDALEDTCTHKFRKNNDLNHLIFTYWQIASGHFHPRNSDFGKKFNIVSNEEINKKIYSAIEKNTYKVICINDDVYDDDDFERIKDSLNSVLEKKYPQKSLFEL